MVDFYALTEELILLLRAHHLDVWAVKFEEAMAGSTGTEIQMALRSQSAPTPAINPSTNDYLNIQYGGRKLA